MMHARCMSSLYSKGTTTDIADILEETGLTMLGLRVQCVRSNSAVCFENLRGLDLNIHMRGGVDAATRPLGVSYMCMVLQHMQTQREKDYHLRSGWIFLVGVDGLMQSHSKLFTCKFLWRSVFCLSPTNHHAFV